jgi:oligoendopeptidase F
MEQLRRAGVDLSRRETIQAVIDQMDDLVGRLEIEAASSEVAHAAPAL